jgi:hypothetical protein
MKTKICTKCGEEKNYDEFYDHHDLRRTEGKRKYTYIKLAPSDVKMRKCKKCVKSDGKQRWDVLGRETQRRRNLKNKYGITVEEYLVKLQEQGGGCEICGGEINGKGGVDHCHKTGKIRGILCSHCNAAIGHMNDDKDRLSKAISYLERYGDKDGV